MVFSNLLYKLTNYNPITFVATASFKNNNTTLEFCISNDLIR